MKNYDRTAEHCAPDFRHEIFYPSPALRSLWSCLLTCGRAQTLPGWGLGHRGQGVLLQYVVAGKGVATVMNRRFPAGAGDVLLIDTESFHEINADPGDPWNVLYFTFVSPLARRWLDYLEADRSPVWRAANPKRFRRLFEAVLRAARRRKPGWEARVSAMIHQAIAELCAQKAAERTRDAGEAAAGWEELVADSPAPVRAVMDRIFQHYHSALSIAEFVAASGVSRSLLHALFAKHLNASPMEALADVRMQRAGELLAHTHLSCKEIALRVGFPDANHFSRRFRQCMGVSARTYRAQAECSAAER
jgi:AraC-like DNA-binding protein